MRYSSGGWTRMAEKQNTFHISSPLRHQDLLETHTFWLLCSSSWICYSKVLQSLRSNAETLVDALGKITFSTSAVTQTVVLVQCFAAVVLEGSDLTVSHTEMKQWVVGASRQGDVMQRSDCQRESGATKGRKCQRTWSTNATRLGISEN